MSQKTQWTPLFFAAETGDVDITTQLIEYGADVAYKDEVLRSVTFIILSKCLCEYTLIG